MSKILVKQVADELTGESIEIIEQWAVQDPLIQQIGNIVSSQATKWQTKDCNSFQKLRR